MPIAIDRDNVVKWRDAVLKQVRAYAQATEMDSPCQVEVSLKEVWDRLDTIYDWQQLGGGPQMQVHWLDVMIECRLESIYGW